MTSLKLLGDVKGDWAVDIFDVILWSNAFGIEPGCSYWDPNADLNNDGIIDIFDGVIIGVNFGKTY